MQPAKPITHSDFIFIHINKTGGTSIEKALGLEKDHLTASEKKNRYWKAEMEKNLFVCICQKPLGQSSFALPSSCKDEYN